jgi:hypothetical protein
VGYDVDRSVASRLGYLLLGKMGKMLEDSQISFDFCPRLENTPLIFVKK